MGEFIWEKIVQYLDASVAKKEEINLVLTDSTDYVRQRKLGA